MKITKAQLDEGNFYVGTEFDAEFEGGVQIDPGLGWVRFRGNLFVGGSIVAGKGTGIEAGRGIQAGGGIEASGGIKAGRSIQAGGGIEAGGGIQARWGIEAGEGIEAGLSICCKGLSAKLRIFAGLCIWRIPTPEEQEIVCELLESGTICYGTLKLAERPHAPKGSPEVVSPTPKEDS